MCKANDVQKKEERSRRKKGRKTNEKLRKDRRN
jgi:hypothetical protein